MSRVLWLVDRPLGARCLEFAATNTDADICGVVSVADGTANWWGESAFQRWAAAHGVSWFEAPAVERAVAETKPDLLMSILFTKVIPAAVVRQIRSVNLHCAPLPAYRGSNATLWAILNAEERFGASLHEISERVDEGPIIEDATFQVPAGITNAELYAMTHDAAYRLLCASFTRVVLGAYEARPQAGPANMYTRDALPSRQLDFSMDPGTVARLARAFHFPPFEPAYFAIGRRRYHVIPASADADRSMTRTGSWR